MSEFSLVAFVLTFGPIILVSLIFPLVELKTLYYGLSLSNMFFGTSVLLPKLIVVQPGRKVVGKEAICPATSSSTNTSNKRISKKEAIIVLRALGPVQLIDATQSWVKVARARRRCNDSDLWFAICCAVENHHGVCIQRYSKVVLEKNEITGQFRAKTHGQTWFLPDWKWN